MWRYDQPIPAHINRPQLPSGSFEDFRSRELNLQRNCYTDAPPSELPMQCDKESLYGVGVAGARWPSLATSAQAVSDRRGPPTDGLTIIFSNWRCRPNPDHTSCNVVLDRSRKAHEVRWFEAKASQIGAGLNASEISLHSSDTFGSFQPSETHTDHPNATIRIQQHRNAQTTE